MSFNIFDTTVANMMKQFGGDGTLQIYSDGNYDTTTGEMVSTKTDYPVNVIVFDYSLKKDGRGQGIQDLIEGADKQVYVQPRNKVSSRYTMPVIMPNRDRILIASEVWKIVALKELNPTNTDAILFELYLKR